ncbi:hypothetical protein EYR41_010704 [Orbilia oligospora]|uniref:Uncharacterized protein n=1 Tax=Orbilia oligospora TaxID=2813651 RepID=A0A7C8U0G4_ORBOL|nr:hypothetical protein TWF751_007283 [Orbilia oligospora]KAF3293379.1 hypothetical protein TWF132_004699 [Orbilia oligospora]TGJ64663.1 hypothetical protein EYR41_010704 [Orbilia oligospora]
MHIPFRALALIGFVNSCQAYVLPSARDLPARHTAIAGCKKWFTTFPGDTCTTVTVFSDITVDDFIKWNPSLKKGVCDEVILPGTNYCVGIQQATTKTTTTAKPTKPTKPMTPGNGVSTPSPIQTGMIKTCNKFHFVAEGQSCPNIVSKYPGISIDLLFKWNPAIGKTCTGMPPKTHICVGVIGGTPTTKATITAAKITAARPDFKSMLKAFFRWNLSFKGIGSCINVAICVRRVVPISSVLRTAPTPTNKPKTTAVKPTPTPVQPGQIKGCKEWVYVKLGQTCQDVIKSKPAFKLTMTQLYTWNPAIRRDCSKMWAGSYLCVRVK